MDNMALLIGYTIITSLGVAAMLLVAWLVARLFANAIWRATGAWLTIRELEEAVKEWRERHPEKAAAAKKRSAART